MSKWKPAIEKIKQIEQFDYSPGWYARSMGISGHTHVGTETLPITPFKPLTLFDAAEIEESEPVSYGKVHSPAPKPMFNATYLTQWLIVATGDRVKMEYGVGKFLRFKCGVCQDNWNVGFDLFPTPESMPTELTDWCDKHHHVCKTYGTMNGVQGRCTHCKWPYHKHAEAQPQFDVASNQWIAAKAPGQVQIVPVPVADIGIKVAKNPTGRKFRE